MQDKNSAMRYISEEEVLTLHISPTACVEWVRDAFLSKERCILSPKISQHPSPDSFFNTMPCCIPMFNRMGVKVVSRLPGNIPPLKSFINLFDLSTGDLLSVMEADWITAMRTGAVAAVAAKTFAVDFMDYPSFGFVGLGSTAKATITCLSSQLDGRQADIWLLEYKDRAKDFATQFAYMENLKFHIAYSKEELISSTRTLFSCVTVMNEQFATPDSYPSGYTCIPVHTKGFQDCDLLFDRVFGDDTGHIMGFKNFARFRAYSEIADVLAGKADGRKTSSERILSYNVGIGLHDVWYASKIYELLTREGL